MHQLLFDSPLKERVRDANYEVLAARIEAAKLRDALQQAEARVTAARDRWQALQAELEQQEGADDGEYQ